VASRGDGTQLPAAGCPAALGCHRYPAATAAPPAAATATTAMALGRLRSQRSGVSDVVATSRPTFDP
jgi:hypothetical protein